MTHLRRSIQDVRRLLETEAAVNDVDDLWRSALQHAVSRDSPSCVVLLFNYGTDANICSHHGDDAVY